MRSFPIVALLLLSGCDAWPTILDNGAKEPIKIQYLHREKSHWSAQFPVKSDVAMSLARAHWVQDITGIKIADGYMRYEWSDQSLRRLERACPSSKIGRNTGFARNCYPIYLGKGRVMATGQEPANLRYTSFGNGG